MSAAFNPPADGIALDGLERAWGHIERATRDGSDREARLNLMSASMQGAMADHCHKTNPRLASREDYRQMLEASM